MTSKRLRFAGQFVYQVKERRDDRTSTLRFEAQEMLGKRLRQFAHWNVDDLAGMAEGQIEHEADAEPLRNGLEDGLTRLEHEHRIDLQAQLAKPGIDAFLRERLRRAENDPLSAEVAEG